MPGLRGPTLMLPIKGLRPMHLTPVAEESLCEAGQAQPSGRAGVSQALWALGYLLPWSPQHSFGVAWMLLPLCLSAKTSRMWTGSLPVLLDVVLQAPESSSSFAWKLQ